MRGEGTGLVIEFDLVGNTFAKLLKEMEYFYSAENTQETSVHIEQDMNKEKYFAARLPDGAWHRYSNHIAT